MTYSIEKIAGLEIIKVTVNSTINQDIRKEIHLKAAKELYVNGLNKLLIDVCNSGLAKDYKTRDSLEMIDYMNEFKEQKNTKVAFLSTQIENHRKTFVNTARLLGEINMEHFTSYDKAVKWLCGE